MAKAATHVLGVDLGSRYIKVVELRRQGDGIGLANWPLIIPTPEGSIDGGQVVDSKEVAAALRDAVRGAGFGTKNVILEVAGDPMVIVRVAEMARMSGKDLKDAVEFEIGRHSQFPIDELIYDYEIIEHADTPEDAENMEVLLAAAHEEAVNSAVRAIMDARLKPVGVDVLPLAVARAAILALGETAFDQTVCCVHIGSTSTFIVMVRRGLPNFIRFLPTAGDALNEAIRSAGIADEETAERVKRAFADVSVLAGYEEGAADYDSVFEVSETPASEVLGPEGEEATQLDVEVPEEALEPPPGPEAAEEAPAEGAQPEEAAAVSPEERELAERVAEALEQPIVDLATEVRRSIEFYRRQHRNEPVQCIMLSGGTALMAGMAQFMSAEVGVAAELCNPFKADVVSTDADPQEAKYLEQMGPLLSPAVGLAARDLIEVLEPAKGR